ncbi:group III truncated hemoglobin [Flavihumibacter sp.]|jgi:hemoglobin|uniref:group III truncated hemoglobin n=1 Tax=Flavihumibacter sp. TaxID=1913981 RepID=UPI002FCB8B07|nr:group III truncated hemoglobin [Flavihumibacter sediminis]
MKKDITGRKDIELLINSFYEIVKEDPVIGYFFNDVVKVNWEKHLPTMYDFWENILFYTGVYNGNPMAIHKNLHHLSALKKEHFEQWLMIFRNTANNLFSGPNTDLIIQRAQSIATVMELKILHPANLD